MVGGGDPGRLRNGRGVGDVFTQWKMYIRKTTVAVKNSFSRRFRGDRLWLRVDIEVNCYYMFHAVYYM